jgi:two-component system sensor histidine kinase RcsD
MRAASDKEAAESVSISFNGSKIEIASSLNSTGMRLVWQVPFGTLLLDTLQNILLPLLLNIGLLALALFGYSTFRFQPGVRATPLRFRPAPAMSCAYYVH